jgi:hypothetical protein
MKHSDSEPGYEVTDIDSGGMGLVAVMLVLGLILCSIVSAFYYYALSINTQRREGAILPPIPTTERKFPAPRLQVHPAEDLVDYQAREKEQLASYGWVDREKGVVRIPIDRAMDLLVERGLPVRGEEERPGPTWEEIMQQRVLQGAGGNAERSLP